jgi:hypothetical protein
MTKYISFIDALDFIEKSKFPITLKYGESLTINFGDGTGVKPREHIYCWRPIFILTSKAEVLSGIESRSLRYDPPPQRWYEPIARRWRKWRARK